MKLEKDTRVSHYKILSAIGTGGMGEVYLAEDTKLDRQVALKILPAEFADDKDRMSRFVREAKSASALSHPNIITIHEINEFEGIHFIAVEYVNGKTLGDYARSGLLKFSSVLDVAIQIASALDEAHRAGIVHRDIKPDNIMIRDNGLVKILDFGIAKLLEPPAGAGGSIGEEDATAIQKPSTTPGMIIGTANYMSPEQAKGEEVDARSDIFSFGVVLYEMLAGHLPFEGKTPIEIIAAIIHKEAKRLDTNKIPPEIERIIGKTLRKDRNERYQTIRDLLIDLKDVKKELEFQDKLEKTVSPEKVEPETKILKATTADELNQTTTANEAINDSVTFKKSNINKVILGALAILLISAIGSGYWYFSGNDSTQISSIAVMPFENNSSSADSEYLSDGLVESLIYRLSQIRNLKVSPTSSVLRYKGKETDAVKAGAELGVAAVMTGRIAQRGEDLIISVELVDIRNSKTLWGERYNRKMSDLLATQAEITGEIVQKLQLKLAGEDQKQLQKTYTADSEAYQLYLKGRFHYSKRTKADLEEGIKYFEQAVARDPDFALAYVGISETYRTMPSYGYVAPKEVRARARAAAQRALEIDPDLAEAHAAVAGVAINFDWDWKKAESEYKKAIELGPYVAEIHKTYGYSFLVPTGRFGEAIVELKRALELEPLSAVYVSHLASSYMYDGQPDKALEQAAAANYLAPGHPTVAYHSSVIYNKAGMYAKVIDIAEEGLTRDPYNQDSLVNAGYAYAKSGQRRKAEDVIQRLRVISESRWVPRSYFAQIYGALGEKDTAIAELEKAFEDRDADVTKINVHPYFDDIRDDPRFAAIAKRVGFPDRK